MAIRAVRLGILRLPPACTSSSRQRPHGATLAGGRDFGFLMVRCCCSDDSALLPDLFQASMASLLRDHNPE
jgi:hypothetical protein